MRVNKKLLAFLALSLTFLLSACSDVANPVSSQDPLRPGNGGAQYYLGYGYDVVASSYVNRGDVKMSHPVLDQKKMGADGILSSQPMPGEQDFQMSVGSSVSRFYSDRNAGLGISAGMDNDVGKALFSGRFSAEFSVSINEDRIDTNSYLRGRTYRYTQDEYIVGATAQTLVKYLTESFTADLTTRTASQILDRYGTHVFIRYYKGGALEFNYAYSGSTLTTDAQMRAALQASFAGISGSISGGSNANSLELEQNSIFHYYTYGGMPIDAFSLADLKINYSEWLNSIAANADICGIRGFDQSFVPVWELAEAGGHAGLAIELETEFARRAISQGKALLVKRIKTDRKEYNTAGSHSYTFSGASSGSPAEVEIYALGAGGGGQGGHNKTGILDNRTGSGGAGGGGAAAYVKLAGIEQAITFSVTVGAGGSGGSSYLATLSESWRSGNPGGNGGSTTVALTSQNTTLTAGGGLGGGGTGTALTGGSGGTATLPASSQYYRSGNSSSGKNGTVGDDEDDTRSTGGNAGEVKYGSLVSFGGGSGAIRQVGGNRQAAGAGGGGSGGYSHNGLDSTGPHAGSNGGNGHVIIIIRYYSDE